MTDEAPKLSDLLGRVVAMRVPTINQTKTICAKIHRIESVGLWLETQEVTETLLRAAGKETAPKTLVLFVPFQGSTT